MLIDDLERIAGAARRLAAADEAVAGILVAEAEAGERTYVCAYERVDGERTWAALDEDGRLVENRVRVREAASIAAMCELAEETAAGGDLDDLRAQLVAVRLTERPPGIEEAESALDDLERTLASTPRVASTGYLDAVGAATRRLERALDDGAGPSPFAEAMRAGIGAVESLVNEVESHYKVPLR